MVFKAPVDALLDVIRGQLGYHEDPAGRSKFGVWWAERHGMPSSWAKEPWCDMFISWAAARVGLTAVVGDSAWTVGHASWFKAQGRWSSQPRKGAIVFFDWGGSRNIKKIDHVGIVEAVKDGGRTVVTLEGNTDNSVRRRYRSPAVIAGYGYPAYPGAAPKPAPKPAENWTEDAVRKLPELKKGSTGWDVKTLVHLLAARDQAVGDGVDDTVFSPVVELRVKAVQTAAGIKVDGIVGPKTWPVLLRV